MLTKTAADFSAAVCDIITEMRTCLGYTKEKQKGRNEVWIEFMI
jgi:hypothetical protein